MKRQFPNWLNTLFIRYNATTAHLFVLWGNIYDKQVNMDDEYVSGPYRYLAQIFKARDLVMFYSLSAGLQFAKEGMEESFRGRYLASASAPSSSGNSSVAEASQAFQQNHARVAPVNSLIGNSSGEALRFLTNVLIDKDAGRPVLIIDNAHNLAPNNPTAANRDDRLVTEIFEKWARDERIREAGSLIILLTPHLGALAESLRGSQTSAVIIRLPKPDTTTRIAYWDYVLANDAETSCPPKELNANVLGRITNGLSLNQIEIIGKEAGVAGTSISYELIKRKKQEILTAEFGDRLKVTVPEWGFDYFGGKDSVKAYLLEVRDYILSGQNRRVPTGILASGPPGTGKTFLFECWAYECGFNFVELTNPRDMWVGKSEETMSAIFATLRDLAPVVVVEDEADQSETSRDTPNGDSGVSNRLRQMKFKFCSDPKIRGQVIWVRISNRDDLIDAAYKRKGRTDDNIPFVLPGSHEYAEIFQVMFARYNIPTKISDFAPFSQMVTKKIYCTGADVEWMVLEADKYAGRAGVDEVTADHLNQAIDDWEIDLDPRDIDHQTTLALRGSSKRLRPDNWQDILKAARKRLGASGVSSVVFPDSTPQRGVVSE